MGKPLPRQMAQRSAVAKTRFAGTSSNAAEELRLQERVKLRSVSVMGLSPSMHQPPGRAERDVDQLAHSIRRQGLIHPPLLRPRDKGFEIVTGHRRVEAWRLLVAKGERGPKIRAFVGELSDDETLFLALAEGRHRSDFSAVEEAELVAAARATRARQLGREPTVRDMADVLPTNRTAVAEALVIADALRDPRLKALVRQADKIGKSLLYRVLRADDFHLKTSALQVAADGGRKSEILAALAGKPAGEKRGQVFKAVLRTDRKKGYDLSIRVRRDMPAKELERAIDALQTALSDLRSRSGSSDEAGP